MKPLSGLGRECHGNIYFVGFFLSCKKGHEYSLIKYSLSKKCPPSTMPFLS